MTTFLIVFKANKQNIHTTYPLSVKCSSKVMLKHQFCTWLWFKAWITIYTSFTREVNQCKYNLHQFHKRSKSMQIKQWIIAITFVYYLHFFLPIPYMLKLSVWEMYMAAICSWCFLKSFVFIGSLYSWYSAFYSQFDWLMRKIYGVHGQCLKNDSLSEIQQ